MNTPIHCSPETLDQFILLPGNLTICIKVLIMKIYFDLEIPLSKLNPRKMLMITLYAKQKKRHRCIEQSFRLCGRRRGWDVSREQHRNMYII